MKFSSAFEAYARRLLYPLIRLITGNKTVAVPLPYQKFRRILVIRYDRLGDMVVTTPVLSFLQRICPNADIDVVTSHRNDALLAADTRVHQRWQLDGTQPPLAILRSARRLARTMRQEKVTEYDLVVCLVFHKTTLAGVVARMLGGRSAITLTLGHSVRQEQYAALFSVLAPFESDGSCSMAELQLKIFSYAFGVAYMPEDMQYHISVGQQHQNYAESIVKQLPDAPLILLNLSAGKTECRWTLEDNQRLVAMIMDEYPDVHILIASMTSEASWADTLHRAHPQRTTLLATTQDVLDFCAVVARVSAVITPDTSVVHIAQAYGKPMVALYSGIYYCTEWAPIHSKAIAVVSPLDTPTSAIDAGSVHKAVRSMLSANLS